VGHKQASQVSLTPSQARNPENVRRLANLVVIKPNDNPNHSLARVPWMP